MKYCEKCGNAMEDNTNFCNKCGAAANAAQKTHAQEQNCLNRLNTGLKHERLCYKIMGIVSLILACIFVLYSVLFFVFGITMTNENAYVIEDNIGEYYIEDFNEDFDYEDGMAIASAAGGIALTAVGGTFVGLSAAFLAVGIVNLVMMKKVGSYRDKLYTDCTDGANHAGSVGSIILAAFFNEIALVFVIINFVFMKKNRATFENIKATQKNYNA